MEVETSPSANADQAASSPESTDKESTETSEVKTDAESPAIETEVKTEEKSQDPFRSQKHKVKVDGVDLELDYDDLVKGYALNKSITQKAQEAAKAKKEAETEKAQLTGFLKAMQQDPKLFLQLGGQLGHDVKKLAEELVWEQIQYEKLSPEAKEALRLKKELEDRDAKLADYEQSKKKTEELQLQQQFEAEIEQDVLNVAQMAGISKLTPRIVARIAELYDNHINANGLKPARDFVAKKVRQWIDQDLEEILSNEDVQKLKERLPKTTLQKLQQMFVDEARKKNLPNFGSSNGSNPTKESKKESKKLGVDDFFKNL